jgi:hypothetical protein
VPTSIVRLAMPPFARGATLPKLRPQHKIQSCHLGYPHLPLGNLTMPRRGTFRQRLLDNIHRVMNRLVGPLADRVDFFSVGLPVIFGQRADAFGQLRAHVGRDGVADRRRVAYLWGPWAWERRGPRASRPAVSYGGRSRAK